MDLAGGDAQGVSNLKFELSSNDGQAAAKMTSNTAVTGFVNARIDHLRIKVNSECGATTGQRILAGAAGLLITGVGAGLGALGGLAVGALIGSSVGPWGTIIGAAIGFIVAFLLDLFSDPKVTVKFDVDADLPFFVGFDKVTELDFGQNSLTLSAGQVQPNGGDPLHLGFRQQSMDNEDPFSVDGAWFHHRHTSYVGDDIPAQSDWSIGNDIGTASIPAQI